jgi:uncharacterized membrane protein
MSTQGWVVVALIVFFVMFALAGAAVEDDDLMP